MTVKTLTTSQLHLTEPLAEEVSRRLHLSARQGVVENKLPPLRRSKELQHLPLSVVAYESVHSPMIIRS